VQGDPNTGYLYDAEGRRIAKGNITSWSCDPVVSHFQLTESYALGQSGEEMSMFNGSGQWQRSNVYGAGRLLATYDANGLHFHITDPLGTRRVQVSGNSATAGIPELDFQSLPFGDMPQTVSDPNAISGANDATPLHFTGKEHDSESGNDYFGARYYASSIGRWMSPDWAAKAEPVPYAKLDDPQSLNLYGYVGNNPMRDIDVDGHGVWAGVCGIARTPRCDELDAAEQAEQERQKAKQQGGAGSSLPSSLAMATGPSIGKIFSTARKLFGFGKDAKEELDTKEQYSFWSTVHSGHLSKLQLDRGFSKYADPMHIGVDNAQIKLDEAEMSYYGTQEILTGAGVAGGIMFSEVGNGTLSTLQMRIDSARQNVEREMDTYNHFMGAVLIQDPN